MNVVALEGATSIPHYEFFIKIDLNDGSLRPGR